MKNELLIDFIFQQRKSAERTKLGFFKTNVIC